MHVLENPAFNYGFKSLGNRLVGWLLIPCCLLCPELRPPGKPFPEAGTNWPGMVRPLLLARLISTFLQTRSGGAGQCQNSADLLTGCDGVARALPCWKCRSCRSKTCRKKMVRKNARQIYAGGGIRYWCDAVPAQKGQDCKDYTGCLHLSDDLQGWPATLATCPR